MQKDVRPLTAGKQKDLFDYLEHHKNETHFVVAFCHDEWNEDLEFQTLDKSVDMFNFSQTVDERSSYKTNHISWSFPCKFQHQDHGAKDMWVYFMYYNMTLAPSNIYTSIDKPMSKDMKLLALKLAIDNSILEYKAKQKGLDYIPKIEQQVQAYPYVPDRIFKDLDVVAMYGAFYLIFVPLTAFMIVFDEMMREKSDNLRLGMQVLGTQNAAYWTSWVITGTLINAFMTIELIIIGKWYKFDVFHRTPGYAFFLMMAGPGQAYISMAMLFSTLAKTRAQSFTVNFCVIMISMVMCIVLQEPTILKKVFFNQNMPPWVGMMVKLFYLMPALQFVKMLMDLTTIACFHFDPMNLNWVASERHFEYNDMFVRQRG